MMIDHSLHRRGQGRLLKYCESLLFRTHPTTLRLQSFEGNDKANGFYRKNGWREAGSYFNAESGSRLLGSLLPSAILALSRAESDHLPAMRA